MLISDVNHSALVYAPVAVVDGGISDCLINNTFYAGRQPSLQNEWVVYLVHVEFRPLNCVECRTLTPGPCTSFALSLDSGSTDLEYDMPLPALL